MVDFSISINYTPGVGEAAIMQRVYAAHGGRMVTKESLGVAAIKLETPRTSANNV